MSSATWKEGFFLVLFLLVFDLLFLACRGNLRFPLSCCVFAKLPESCLIQLLNLTNNIFIVFLSQNDCGATNERSNKLQDVEFN